MAEHTRATDGLRRHAQQRCDEARRRIDKAIRNLRKHGEPINVNAVARTAKVTRKTIYAHPDLLEVIRAQTLRRQLATQQTHLSKLRTELKARDEALAAAHGEIARLSNGQR
ncbi:Putative transposase/integrase [Mycolicibacterium phlei]|uniref:DUF6262 family protein n=1 Tax=Mycobacteroides chelonae TaxID=1774 RepID=UPI0007B43907|nr:DUF6262 family protein [Mycobacteroides chelonae]ANA97153.1 hypothetical protein BB28_04835 [Mycobacteroides chelonae CCUG 47445]OLT80784.1 hypothetical protein BKG56_00250 [Mycobacteroides chelonae]ORV16809.1 hypothetical protein AWB96_00535 [Mycobacteroides chelonae]VEG15131.1 Putative transposase/integrase [Mycolicibacterium phlei]